MLKNKTKPADSKSESNLETNDLADEILNGQDPGQKPDENMKSENQERDHDIAPDKEETPLEEKQEKPDDSDQGKDGVETEHVDTTPPDGRPINDEAPVDDIPPPVDDDVIPKDKIVEEQAKTDTVQETPGFSGRVKNKALVGKVAKGSWGVDITPFAVKFDENGISQLITEPEVFNKLVATGCEAYEAQNQPE